MTSSPPATPLTITVEHPSRTHCTHCGESLADHFLVPFGGTWVCRVVREQARKAREART